MTIEVPQRLEAALQAQASALGVSASGYVCTVLERELSAKTETVSTQKPRRTARGILAAYGPAPSFEEFAEARKEMWRNFGENYPL